MPIIRKIIDAGATSKAVILPKSWLEYFEKEAGGPIEYVAMEVNRILKIEPILEKKRRTHAWNRLCRTSREPLRKAPSGADNRGKID